LDWVGLLLTVADFGPLLLDFEKYVGDKVKRKNTE
jgi:hypothetical protein